VTPALEAHPPKWVPGMSEDEYFSHSALSASGMKVLLKSPKHFVQSREVRIEKATFDTGHAIHTRVLGTGMDVEVIPSALLSGPNQAISSAKAKAFVEEVRAAGKVPLKPAVFAHVTRASEAVLANPKARALLEVGGESEVSLFATDPETGVRIRGRLDRVHRGGRLIIDLKSCVDLSLLTLRRIVDAYGYDLSAETYRFLFELVTGEVAEPVHLIFMEKEPPYDVRVVKLGPVWSDGGWQKLRRALEVYRACVEAGVWPGVDDLPGPVEELDAPGWYAARTEQAALELMD